MANIIEMNNTSTHVKHKQLSDPEFHYCMGNATVYEHFHHIRMSMGTFLRHTMQGQHRTTEEIAFHEIPGLHE